MQYLLDLEMQINKKTKYNEKRNMHVHINSCILYIFFYVSIKGKLSNITDVIECRVLIASGNEFQVEICNGQVLLS